MIVFLFKVMVAGGLAFVLKRMAWIVHLECNRADSYLVRQCKNDNILILMTCRDAGFKLVIYGLNFADMAKQQKAGFITGLTQI
ncbi:TPA: glutathione peroxidase [Neisseria meningitidis]|uniref:glutathione peroxidase n=2 Tax=Neisseria meningitidis TaxID=487 RepID=UPI000317E4AB|nr:glutathione peroxidase [Neisseria meningitidis]MCV6687072.1 glutathione peroxidase [Neisseria meningitidis]MCV6691431.1 glutathione peroxidase [Neisseria meningitidis]MCV6693260.1 glutathione peroxidase [Neisseria meningitidis]MCV6697933.1 glutathione peroxidase [Neisseria meningitidis]MCV6699336.1 glutathione peroxidase [Neisseria meningitidis]